MLKKSARLTREDVEAVLARGISVSIPPRNGQKSLISAKFLAAPGSFRVAAVAPKSVAKSATERNRVRRAVYRAILSLPTPKKGGMAVVFVRSLPKPPLTPAFAHELSLVLEKISA